LQISYCCSSVAAKRYIVLAQKPKGVVLVRWRNCHNKSNVPAARHYIQHTAFLTGWAVAHLFIRWPAHNVTTERDRLEINLLWYLCCVFRNRISQYGTVRMQSPLSPTSTAPLGLRRGVERPRPLKCAEATAVARKETAMGTT
jgi:hypothetical protein